MTVLSISMILTTTILKKETLDTIGLETAETVILKDVKSQVKYLKWHIYIARVELVTSRQVSDTNVLS